MASFMPIMSYVDYTTVSARTEQQRKQYPELPVTMRFNTFCLMRHAAAMMSPKYTAVVYAGPPPGDPVRFVRRLIWC